MRKYALVMFLILALMVAAVAFADPPGDDPSNGNGANGNAGCQGVDTADDNRDRNPNGANSAADPAFDLVNRILGDC